MPNRDFDLSVEQRDCYQEIANISMGQAADRLARLLDAYILLPVPRVNVIESNDLNMALQNGLKDASVYIVCQGFVGAGISGEVLLFFNNISFDELATLLGYYESIDNLVKTELLTDASTVMAGSYIKGFGDQLGIKFVQNHPFIIDKEFFTSNSPCLKKNAWHKTLAIDFQFSLEHLSIDCDLLFVFSENSVPLLNQKIEYLLD